MYLVLLHFCDNKPLCCCKIIIWCGGNSCGNSRRRLLSSPVHLWSVRSVHRSTRFWLDPTITGSTACHRTVGRCAGPVSSTPNFMPLLLRLSLPTLQASVLHVDKKSREFIQPDLAWEAGIPSRLSWGAPSVPHSGCAAKFIGHEGTCPHFYKWLGMVCHLE